MDTLTHALSGALLARATAPRQADAGTLPLGRRIFVGFLAAAAPDLDFVTAYVSPLAYIYYHRGVTHSLVLLPIWSVALAWLFSLLWRRDRDWRAYAGVVALGLGAHIAGDWIMGFGTMVFAPFSDLRVALGMTFIIDLWFTGIILVALAVSAAWRASRVPALAGLAVLVGYVAFQGMLQSRAVEWGETYADGRGLKGANVTAVPRPVSPYNWMVVVRNAGDYHYSFVNLARREPRRIDAAAGFIARLDAHYLPLDRAQWVRASLFPAAEPEAALAREAWQHPKFAFFRWFAGYPVLARVETGNPSTCVWFGDLRFLTPGRARWPFRYGMCREATGPWERYELAADGARVPLN